MLLFLPSFLCWCCGNLPAAIDAAVDAAAEQLPLLCACGLLHLTGQHGHLSMLITSFILDNQSALASAGFPSGSMHPHGLAGPLLSESQRTFSLGVLCGTHSCSPCQSRAQKNSAVRRHDGDASALYHVPLTAPALTSMRQLLPLP